MDFAVGSIPSQEAGLTDQSNMNCDSSIRLLREHRRACSWVAAARLSLNFAFFATLSSFTGGARAQQEAPEDSTSPTSAEPPQPAPPAAQSSQVQAADQPIAAPPSTAVAPEPHQTPQQLVSLSVVQVLPTHDADTRQAQKRKSAVFDRDSSSYLGDPWGDSQDELRAAGLSFRFLLQTHYAQTFANSSQNPSTDYRIGEDNLVRDHDGWDMNRLFFRTDIEPLKALGFRMTLDLAELKHKDPKQLVKQTYVELRPLPKRIQLQIGVLKLPFSILELDPVSKYEFTSFGQANQLVRDLGFAGRDIGIHMLVAPLPKPKDLHLIAGVYRGHAHDELALLAGAVAARAVTEPVQGLRLGADWVTHPSTVKYVAYVDPSGKGLLPNPEDASAPITVVWDRGRAYSADVTFSRRRLTLRIEGMLGNRVDHNTQYLAKNFAAFWALAAYRFAVGHVDLMPAMRAEWLDTDTEHGDGLRRQLTLGLSTYFTKSIRVLVDVTRTDVQPNTPIIEQPLPLRAQPYLALSNTRVTGQLQLDL